MHLRSFTAAALAAISLGGVAAAAPSDQARHDGHIDHEVEMTVGQEAHVDGGAPGGMNPDYFGTTGVLPAGECNHEDPTTYCEVTLLHVITEVPEDVERGRLRTPLTLTVTSPDFPVSDFDLVVWESNEDGERLSQVGYSGSGGYANAVEQFSFPVTTTPEAQDAYYLVDVVYFLGGVNYDLDITFG